MYTVAEKRAYWISQNENRKIRAIQEKVDEANRFIHELVKMQNEELDQIDDENPENTELYKALCAECEYRYGQMIQREKTRRDSLWFPSPANDWLLNKFLPSFKDGQRITEKQFAIFAKYGNYDPQSRTGLNANGKIYRITENYFLTRRGDREYTYTLEIITL